MDFEDTDISYFYYSKFLDKSECDYYRKFLSKVEYNSDEDSQVFIYGKWIPIPRKQVGFGDEGVSYKFSGTTVPARPWPDFIIPLKEELEDYVNDFIVDICKEKKISHPKKKYKLSFVLVNFYRNGGDYIGWHSDDEKDLKETEIGSIIISISLGITRPFIFKERTKYNPKKKIINLNDGDLLIMFGDTNKKYMHSVPKRKRIKEPRWNLTFRLI